MTPEQAQKLDELYAFMESLKNTTTIPFDVAVAFADRFDAKPDVSGKTAASATQGVDEAGIDTYNVTTAPSGFITIKVNGVPRNVPYYV